MLAQSYFTRDFSQDDGLGNNRIADIVQDWKGYLWIANYGAGVTCYDGKEFINFDENDGLSHDRVKCLALDRYQRLWIGTQGGGISILEGERFVNFSDSISGISKFVNCLFKDAQDVMWIGTDQGLYCYHAGEVKGLSETTRLPDTQVQDIYQDENGFIWVSFWENGLYCLAPKEEGGFHIERLDRTNGLLHNTVTKIGPGPDNQLLIGTMTGAQFLRMEGKTPVVSSGIRTLPASQVFDIAHDSTNGTLISFGKNGLFKIDQKGSVKPHELDLGGWIYTSFVDRENVLWLSVWENSLLQVREANIKTFQEGSNLPFRQASSMSYGSSGLLVGSAAGLFKWSGNRFVAVDSAETFENKYEVIHQADDLTWLVRNGELMLRSKNGWSEFRDYRELVPDRIMDITSDQDGNVWMANWNSPLVKYDGTSFSLIRNDSLASTERYFRIITASDNTIWLGSRNEGAFQLYHNQVTQYADEDLLSNRVIDICEASDGSIWLACQDGGVVGIQNGEVIARIDEGYGISTNVVSVAADELGTLWIGSKNGVYAMNIPALQNGDREYAIKISENDGLLSEECLPGQLLIDSLGYVWAGTKRGLAQINRRVLMGSSEPVFPFIHIRNIRIDYRDVEWSSFGFSIDPITQLPLDAVFDHDQGQITFDIEAVSTRKKDNILYRYKLDGQDEEFSPISSSPSITYHDIEPGQYELQVIPCDSQGRCDDDAVTFTFQILKPFWKTWWFYLIAIAVANLLLYFLVKLREKNLVDGRKLLENKVRERTWEIEQQKKIIEENNRSITDSIRYAKRIQSAMLVSEEELRGVFEDSFLIHLPKDIVSGDFYFVTQVGDYKVFAVADCTGHGVPGAVMGMLGYTLFNEAIRKKELTNTASTFDFIASSVIKMLRQQSRVGESKDAMDASIIIYNTRTHELEFSGANNNAIIRGDVEYISGTELREKHVDSEKLYELIANRQPLGIDKTGGIQPFSSTKVKVRGKATVYLMSDGYVDQFGGDSIEAQAMGGKKFKISRLRTMIAAVGDEPLQHQKSKFHQSLANWKGPLEQVDDITLAGVCIHGPD